MNVVECCRLELSNEQSKAWKSFAWVFLWLIIFKDAFAVHTFHTFKEPLFTVLLSFPCIQHLLSFHTHTHTHEHCHIENVFHYLHIVFCWKWFVRHIISIAPNAMWFSTQFHTRHSSFWQMGANRANPSYYSANVNENQIIRTFKQKSLLSLSLSNSDEIVT